MNSLRSPMGRPLSLAIAACASASVDISTKPKPLQRPESPSMMSLALTTVPQAAKSLSSSNCLVS